MANTEIIFMKSKKEIFQFQFMQTDPNFANFLYEPGSYKINLIDMGACRDYRSEFVKPYMELVAGAVRNDRHEVLMKSRELGFLTGHETSKMENAHVNSVITVGQEMIRIMPNPNPTQV